MRQIGTKKIRDSGTKCENGAGTKNRFEGFCIKPNDVTNTRGTLLCVVHGIKCGKIIKRFSCSSFFMHICRTWDDLTAVDLAEQGVWLSA